MHDLKRQKFSKVAEIGAEGQTTFGEKALTTSLATEYENSFIPDGALVAATVK